MNPMYINNRKVAILLSCYNGEKYVHELIDSIINQSYQNYTLYIRDDGSVDTTYDLIKTFGCENIVIIPQSENLGSRRSFLYMMSIIESEYYMFCDQDDVWMNQKIEKSLNAIQNIEIDNPQRPIIVHTDLQLVDGNMNKIADSYWEYNRVPVDVSHKFKYMCHFNDVTGCAMIFNKIARDLAIPYTDIKMPKHLYHDSFIGLIVAKNNGIIYPLKEQTIWFRRHGANETNPLIHNKSILQKPFHSIVWLVEQYKRHRFYKQIKEISFFNFICNKIIISIKIKIWNRKHP